MPKTTNIAITGIARAGKTTFLTSLLWHLDQIGNRDFKIMGKIKESDGFLAKINPLAKKKQIRITLGKVSINKGRKTPTTFNYANIIGKIINNKEFPKKTTDCTECSVEFIRSDWNLYRQRLNFVDFPGERIADIALMLNANYQRWSDNVFEEMALVPQTDEAIEQYTEKIQSADSADACVSAYKELIAKSIKGYGVLVSPSTMLLDTKGQSYKEKMKIDPSDDDDVKIQKFITTAEAGRPCEEFAPIPLNVTVKPEIVKQFAQNYKQYRRKIVFPLLKKILKAHKLVILINIPALLEQGDKAYNGAVRIATKLACTLDPTAGIFKKIPAKITRKMGFNTPLLRQIIFVASQVDRVHPADIDNDNMTTLLANTVDGIISKVVPLRCEKTYCAAILTTKPSNAADGNGQQRKLHGRVKGKPEDDYAVSPLPDKMPPQFFPSDYSFPATDFPDDFPKNITYPPDHVNLDHVFNLIIN